MAGGQSAVDFGSGIARGLAGAFSQDRQNTMQREREREDRDRQNASFLIDHLMKSGRVEDYADLQPLFDVALGLRHGKKGESTKTHAMLSAVLKPTFGAGGGDGSAAPSGSPGPGAAPAAPPSTSVVDSSGAIAPALTDAAEPSAPQAPSAAAPAAGAHPTSTSLGGIRLRTDEGMQEAQLALDERKFRVQAQRARDIYNSFKQFDSDFTLRDAMRAAGFDVDVNRGSRGAGTISQLGTFGAYLAKKQSEKAATGDDSPLTSDEVLTARSEFYAANRSMGVNREAIARELYGKAFALLDQSQQAEVIKKETSLIGQQAYSRTASTELAQFNAPIDAATAKATNLPVGTTGPQVAGQTILTDAEQGVQQSLAGLSTTLTDIRDRLIPAALPHTSDITGTLTAGAAYQYRKRVSHTKEVAALESTVANTVNTLAKARGQVGAQTEPDIDRAMQALVNTQASLLNGDTVETAQQRINESMKILDEVLARLPKQAMPATPAATVPAGGRGPSPARTPVGSRPPRGAGAPGQFTVKVGDKTYTFPTQAAADLFKRGAGITQQ